MSTNPQQDRNVEARASESVTANTLSTEELNRMADYTFQHGSLPGCDAIKLFNALASAEEELYQLRNSRPSQPPQNVEAGDAAKEVVEEKLIEEIEKRVADYYRANSTYTSDFSDKTVKTNRQLLELLAALLIDYHPTIIAALRLALSATSSHGEKGMGELADTQDLIALVEKIKRRHLEYTQNPSAQTIPPDICVLLFVEVLDAIRPLWSKSASATGEQKEEAGEMALQRKIVEWQKYRRDTPQQIIDSAELDSMPTDKAKRLLLAIEAADILDRYSPAIIAASSNAERLKVADGLLREWWWHHVNRTISGWTMLFAAKVRKVLGISPILDSSGHAIESPAPAQTPGDERQG